LIPDTALNNAQYLVRVSLKKQEKQLEQLNYEILREFLALKVFIEHY
jgi:hypothetical protein